MRRWLTALTLALVANGGAAQACSETTPCALVDREYFVALPDGDAKAAIVYIHGWGGSGQGVFRNTGMVSRFLARGYAVIAPNGLPRQNGNGRSWRFHPDRPGQLEDIAFINAEKEDATQRFALDPSKVLLTGFSIGGSMTAYVACLAPESFPAYSPIGGNFWRPHPEGCAGPVRLLHTHGCTDGTVPLKGRVVNRVPVTDPSAFAQGDIFHALDIWRQTNGCVHLKADRFVTEGAFWRRIWDRCAEGTALEFALFPGGHTIPRGWSDLAIDWFEGL